jgi:hypothetical protein
MRSPSSEDEERSTTSAFPEDPPAPTPVVPLTAKRKACIDLLRHPVHSVWCTRTSDPERGQREETSGGDVNGGDDLEGAGGGVLAPSGDGLSSLEGKRVGLVPLLSSIDCVRRARKVNPR